MNNAEQSPYGTIAGLVDKRKKRLEYDLFHETQRLLRTDRSKHNSCLENFQLSDPLPLRISESLRGGSMDILWNYTFMERLHHLEGFELWSSIVIS